MLHNPSRCLVETGEVADLWLCPCPECRALAADTECTECGADWGAEEFDPECTRCASERIERLYDADHCPLCGAGPDSLGFASPCSACRIGRESR